MLIAFTKVELPYGWLGNMSPFPIEHGGHTWRTTEALFQALRFAPDSTTREDIRAELSPMVAKMVAKGRRADMIIEPQSPEDVENMRVVLRLKVRQHGPLVYKLVDMAEDFIVEDCTNRQRGSGLFWGAALVNGSLNAADAQYLKGTSTRPRIGEWNGENMLGKLWMELRDGIRKDPGIWTGR